MSNRFLESCRTAAAVIAGSSSKLSGAGIARTVMLRLTKVAIGVLLMAGLSTLRLEAAGPAAIPIVDQRGGTFSLAALPQRFVAVTFVASRCADACPIANALFAKLQKRIIQSGRSLALVTLTLDPDFDTPFVMSKLGASFNADPAVWHLASGKPANIRGLMHAFGVAVQPDEKGIPDEHTSAVYILDTQRKLRTILLLSTSLPDDVFAATQ
jgi:cytochrome oxidase Cu insertion factor (SCO1/SenC/PrrC family)